MLGVTEVGALQDHNIGSINLFGEIYRDKGWSKAKSLKEGRLEPGGRKG